MRNLAGFELSVVFRRAVGSLAENEYFGTLLRTKTPPTNEKPTINNWQPSNELFDWSGEGFLRAECALNVITLDVIHASRYYPAMIVSFKDADTEALASGWRVKRLVNIQSVARRKLRQLQIAGRLEDLRVPPGNRLDVLRGERAGQHSIRINDQYRVCFRWTMAGAEDVEVVDYH
jgi:proteic killer suppression protein